MLKINILIFASILIFSLIFLISFKANGTQEYDFCLRKSYEYYKKTFLKREGRIIDPDRNNITTSEGQSYIMLRSVTIGDQKTFDLAYNWAKKNLQRPDKLFSWLWGKDEKGKYRILDYNSATDADIDIAFALIMAKERWDKYYYLAEAGPIIRAIWDKETKRIGDYIVLMPGAQQALSSKIEINPSYFSPYAFRFFQKYDDAHDWSCLIDSSYYYLNEVMAITATGLPPNWFLIEDGQIVLENSERSDFSYDAIRVFVRILLDYARTGEKRAVPILSKSNFFIDKWKTSKTIYVNYKANGELRDENKFIGAIAILIPVMNLYNPDVADEIYKQEIEPYFQNKKYWEISKDYYAKNLLWFGCYLYNDNSKEYKQMHKLRVKGY